MTKNPGLFPWGDDLDEELPAQKGCLCITSPSHPASAACESQGSKGLEIHGIHWMLPNSVLQAGKILAHCRDAVWKLRLATGGTQLAVYKIGITHDCTSRFELYQKNGWTKMLVMYKGTELGQVEMLEAALISHEQINKQCRNIRRGGEGMRTKEFHSKFDPPFFCYCVSARADQGRWIS